MNRYLLSLIVMMLAGQICQAQLVIPRDSNYYYDWWYGDYLANNPTHLLGCTPIGQIAGNGAQYFQSTTCGLVECASGQHTDSALNVVGIAVAIQRWNLLWITGHNVVGYRDEYVRLYKKVNDTMMLIDEVKMDQDDSANFTPHQYPQRIYYDFENAGCDTIDFAVDFMMGEFYFDTPHLISDSFYLGVTFNTDSVTSFNVPGRQVYFRPGQFYLALNDPSYADDCDYAETVRFPQMPFRYRWIRSADGYEYPWQDIMLPIHLMIYPIIRYGSPVAACDTVDKFSLQSQTDSLFAFEWFPIGNQHEWQFTYVPYGMSPDSGLVTNHSTTNASVVVEPNVRYQAFARAVCPGGRYGDWSHPEEFIYEVDTHSTPRYRLTLLSDDSSMGSVSGDGIYDSAAVADIVATANSGYRFDHWNDAEVENPRTIVVVGDSSFTAYFVAETSGGDTTQNAIRMAEHLSVSIAPNPTSGRVRVSADEPMRQVAVYDMAGKEVFEAKATVPKSEWDLDLGSLPSGSYIVKITTKSLTTTRKLIVE